MKSARGNLDHSDITAQIDANQLRFSQFSIVELHLQAVAAFNDMRVGDNVTVEIPHPT